MNILLYDNSGHPFQVELSRQLARRGNNVTHLYSKSFSSPKGNLILQKDDPETLNIIGIKLDKPFRKYNLVRRKFQEKSFAVKVINVIKDFEPNIIICSNVPIDTLNIVFKYSTKNGIKFITWVQDIYFIAIKNYFDKKYKLLSFFIHTYYRKTESRIFSNSDACVSISKDFNSILNNMGVPNNKITVIENWANINEIVVKNKSNDWAKQNNIEETFNFIYTGTMGLKHNPDLIVALCQHFQSKNVKVIVTSEGIGADYLMKKKKKLGLKNLIILPFQDYNNYSNVLASSDVLVAILEKEAGILSVPSKILSYLCAGRPILAAMPLDNLASKILLNNDAGLVADTNDINSFLAKAEELYDNTVLRSRLSKNALKYAEEKFNLDKITNKFISIIRNIS